MKDRGSNFVPLLLERPFGNLRMRIRWWSFNQKPLKLSSFWPQEGFEHSPITSTNVAESTTSLFQSVPPGGRLGIRRYASTLGVRVEQSPTLTPHRPRLVVQLLLGAQDPNGSTRPSWRRYPMEAGPGRDASSRVARTSTHVPPHQQTLGSSRLLSAFRLWWNRTRLPSFCITSK